MRLRHLFAATAFACVALTYASASTADNLGKTLDWYNNSTTLTFGGLHYSNGGTIPQIKAASNYHFGDFYIGNSVSFAFGRINGYKANRYTLGFTPGWLIPLNSDLALVPYARIAGVLQDTYSGTSLQNTQDAQLKLGYEIGGGAGIQWSPVHRLVINPSADVAYYRQAYAQFDNQNNTHSTVYLSSTETREQLAVNYYPWQWLHFGLDVEARQFGAHASSLISYGAGLGISF
jgi:hypothetical protein